MPVLHLSCVSICSYSLLSVFVDFLDSCFHSNGSWLHQCNKNSFFLIWNVNSGIDKTEPKLADLIFEDLKGFMSVRLFSFLSVKLTKKSELSVLLSALNCVHFSFYFHSSEANCFLFNLNHFHNSSLDFCSYFLVCPE